MTKDKLRMIGLYVLGVIGIGMLVAAAIIQFGT